MATIGSLLFRLGVINTDFNAGLTQAGARLDGFASRAAMIGDKVGALAGELDASTSSFVKYAEAAQGCERGAKSFLASTGAFKEAVAKTAIYIEAARLSAEAASLSFTILGGAIHVVTVAAKTLAAPFVLAARAIGAIVGAAQSVGKTLAYLFTPIGRIILALRVLIGVARGLLFVVGGLALAFRVLKSVLTLNVFALVRAAAAAVAFTATLVAMGVAKTVSFGLRSFKSVLLGLAPAALGAVVGLGALALSAGNTVDQAGDMADRLGTGVNQLMALRYAAQLTGSSGEALDASLSKLNANLGDAVAKGGPAADALKRLGLDVNAVAAMDPTAAFEAIAGGFEGINSPAEQAALAMDLFGKGGLQVLTTLKSGPAEIRRLAGEFTAFGGVTEAQRTNIGAMFDSFDRLRALLTGFGAQIAAKVAPYVVALAGAIVDLATSTGSAGPIMEAALDGVGLGVEYVGHAIDFVRLGWLQFQRIGLSALAAVARGVASFLSFIPGVSQTTVDTARLMGEELDKLAAKADEDGKKLLVAQGKGEQFKAAFDKVRSGADNARSGIDATTKSAIRMGDALGEAAGKVTDLMDKLREERDTFGLSSQAMQLYQLRKAGASTQTIAEAQAIANEIKTLEQAKTLREKLSGDAESLFGDTRTPLEKFQAELQKIQNLKQQGYISNELAARAGKGAENAFMGDNATKRAAALELGSKEARSAVLDFRGQNRDKPLNEVAKSSKETAKQSAIASALLTRLVSGVEALKTDVAPIF